MYKINQNVVGEDLTYTLSMPRLKTVYFLRNLKRDISKFRDTSPFSVYVYALSLTSLSFALHKKIGNEFTSNMTSTDIYINTIL